MYDFPSVCYSDHRNILIIKYRTIIAWKISVLKLGKLQCCFVSEGLRKNDEDPQRIEIHKVVSIFLAAKFSGHISSGSSMVGLNTNCCIPYE